MSPTSEGTRSEQSTARRLPDEVPRRLGSYEIESVLGNGGMGMVFKGRHVLLGQPVAIKVLHPDLPRSDRFVTRFHREMATFGQLSPHPNLVRALYAGEESGVFYLAMEYVEGRTLERIVRARGPLPERVAREFIRQAALGLEAIREAGLVHRDIKPANLMLAAGGLVKILDMGLVRLREPEGNMPELTGTGVVLGTLNYLAPEQAADPRTVDIRADVYSLGCTLYHLLTGRPPYQEYATAASKIHAHAYVPFPEVDRAIDPALAQMLARMTRKDPADRPATPREVAEAMGPPAGVDLAPFLTGAEADDGGGADGETATADRPHGRTAVPAASSETGARVVTPVPEPRAAARRRVLPRVALAALAVACGALLVYGLYSSLSAPPGDGPARPAVPPEPVDPILAAGTEPPSLDGLTPFEPHDLLARAPVQVVWQRDDGTAFRAFDPVRKQLIVSSPEQSLFLLGRLHTPTFVWHVKIKQTRWTGGPGVCLGFRPSKALPASSDFQYLRFGQEKTPAGTPLFTLARGRGRLRTLGDRKVFQWEDRKAVPLDRIPHDAWLILEVAGHRLQRVLLDGAHLEALTPVHDPFFTDDDHRGGIGLLNTASSCVFHQVSLTRRTEP